MWEYDKDPLPRGLYRGDGIIWFHTHVDWNLEGESYEDKQLTQKIPVPKNCVDCGKRILQGDEVFTQNFPAYRRTLCMHCVKQRGYIW